MLSQAEFTAITAQHSLLRARLGQSTGELGRSVDVIVTAAEVNYRHGTGALVRTMFGSGEGALSIRSLDYYDGEHSFGEWAIKLVHGDSDRCAIRERVRRVLGNFEPRRVFCIPYHADEISTALAIHEVFGAPIAAHIMDDGNVLADLIPDDLMREFLERSSVRFAISDPMRAAYEAKFGLRFSICPPMAPARLVNQVPVKAGSGAGVMVGNVWSSRWSDLLRTTIRESGRKIDWYGSRQRAMGASEDDLARDGIVCCGLIPEDELAERLREYSYAIVPTGMLEEDDERSAISQLSLPSRIVFTLATSGTPMIVVGSPETAAAKFVVDMGVGVCCEYDATSFKRAVKRVSFGREQLRLRERAAELAPRFSSAGAADWLWAAAEQGVPPDDRFDAMMRRTQAAIKDGI